MHQNPLISFLRHYGPIASQDNMYDERIHEARLRYGVAPIEIAPDRLANLLENFNCEHPVSVFLTGTAGDGKTFHCRRVYEELGGSSQEWSKGDKIIRLPLPKRQAELIIIKDLSELTDAEKLDWLPKVAATLQGADRTTVFLVAANDGQLLASWRHWSEDDADKLQVFRTIEGMLVNEHEIAPAPWSLRLYNLSRSGHGRNFELLLKAITDHKDWERCQGCPAADGKPSCPILINRDRLKADSTSQFRHRLRQLIELAASNDQHIPIRQQLLLIVNVLLGQSGGKNALIDCQRAQKSKSDDYRKTSPYVNAFGKNLSERERYQHQAFMAMESFGAGKETDNEIDDLLVFGSYENSPTYLRLIGEDEQFGDAAYRLTRKNYVEGDRSMLADFIRDLEAQRQRLFFELIWPTSDGHLDPWRLTVFRYAGEYLKFREALRNQEHIDPWVGALVRGLNRTFSGMMVDTNSDVYLTVAGGDGRSRVARFLVHELRINRAKWSPYVAFDWPEGRPNPRICVMNPLSSTDVFSEIELRLTHFEYLLRVASGSLPASFSRQCFEDFHDFKVRTIDRITALEQADESPSDIIELTSVQVGTSGDLHKAKIEIRVPR